MAVQLYHVYARATTDPGVNPQVKQRRHTYLPDSEIRVAWCRSSDELMQARVEDCCSTTAKVAMLLP